MQPKVMRLSSGVGDISIFGERQYSMRIWLDADKLATFEAARFICTCNAVGRIIAPLRSRMQELIFRGLDQEEMFLKAAEILLQENVSFEPETLAGYVAIHAPDMRKLLCREFGICDFTQAAPLAAGDGSK